MASRPANALDYRHQPTGNSFGPARRFSRQNTIQVVSDVQGVLTDILLDIVPYATAQLGPQQPQQQRPGLQQSSAATVDYGSLRSRDWDHSRSSLQQQDRSSPGSADDGKSRPSRPKRLNLLQAKNRTAGDYNSIDDLSPEYTVLPFVKRLKILNERQKIVELQRALTVVVQDPPGANNGAGGSSKEEATGTEQSSSGMAAAAAAEGSESSVQPDPW